MTQEKKIRSLVSIMVFLFITNVVLLFFLIFSRDKPGDISMRDKRSIVESFLEDSIGFDNVQMRAYHDLRKDDFEKRTPIIDSMKTARSGFYQNIYSDNVPDSVINRQAAIFSERQISVDRHMLQYFKNVRKICTPLQLPKFDSSFKTVVEKINPGRFKKARNQ